MNINKQCVYICVFFYVYIIFNGSYINIFNFGFLFRAPHSILTLGGVEFRGVL